MTISKTSPVSGSCDSQVKASEFFINLLEDLSSFKRYETKGIMEAGIEEFSDMLVSSSGASNIINGINNNDGQYSVSFDFSDLNLLLNELSLFKNQDILKINGSRLELNINIDNYHFLKEIIPFLAIDEIAVYGPEYNRDYSEEDYYTMMNFIAGESAEEGIKSSNVSVNLTLPSEVKNTNGKKLSSTEVQFSFSLIDFLLLKKPIYFYCEF